MKMKKRHPLDDIQAIKFTGKNGDEIRDMVGEKRVRFDSNGRCFIGNFTFYQPVNMGDWVVLESDGNVYATNEAALMMRYVEVES